MSNVIVITGASAGIGAALAMQLGKNGHRLVLAARREKEVNEVARRIGGTADGPVVLGTSGTGESAEAIAVRTDVTRRTDVERLRDRALEAFGHVDVWVNNAGREEVYTNPALAQTAVRYFQDGGAFEAQ